MGKVDEGGVFRKIPHPVATGWSSYLYAPPVHHFMEVYPEGTSLKAERLINDELYLKLSNMSEKEIEESKTKETIAPGFKTVDGPRKANISGSDSIYDYNTSMYITKTHNPMSGGSIISLKQDYDNEFFETVPKPVVVIVALEKDYTDLFEMEPEPVMTDYTDLFEMEPEPAMTDYTDLFEMEPEPVMTDYTDLFETEPEPAMTDYTDLFETETEPAMTDYTDLFEVEPVRKDYTDLFEVEPVRTDYTYLFEMDFQ
jgi:TorA maturation chaperone TorD